MVDSKKSYFLVGESGWDEMCIEKNVVPIKDSYLHNDYFSESNLENTRVLKRFVAFLKAAYFTFKFLLKGRVIFSSLNMEVKVIAFLMFWNPRCFFVNPNILGDPKGMVGFNAFFLRLLITLYRKRFVVTDDVSYSCLQSYGVGKGKTFTFSVPPKNEVARLTYIVVLPALFSHNSTKNDLMFFSYYEKLVSCLCSAGRTVKVLPHPREEGRCDFAFDERCELIESSSLENLDQDRLCYLSSFSALSLNRRYGGKFGCWVEIPECDVLPEALIKAKKDVVNIEHFVC